MNFEVFSLFPDMFETIFKDGIISRALNNQLVKINLHDWRDKSTDNYKTVDDYQYGGGPGMVLKPEPLFDSVESVITRKNVPVILLSPQGKKFDQKKARELSNCDQIALICGRYGGFDERIRKHLATEELSIGDYVMSGGELAAMVVIDTVSRLLPGVLGNEDSYKLDSFYSDLIQYPQYTRPFSYRGWDVPEILLSGNHKEINDWRRKQSIIRTAKKRPEMIDPSDLSFDELRLLEQNDE
ncbi:MAG: tRNA (guanosine(37)-N1)-methyltransferase TrmD [SAR202 cluster bacterium]|nr:tRNA (guanosine(37)-N1)-methyltransferase TrmD [Chloroflexota bacterium]MQG50447.1 tRNA (guanosine(37)-N1)-methyltransferase TrmD [SAR202 cluster bacterium]